jgi:alpha-mannosidase II
MNLFHFQYHRKQNNKYNSHSNSIYSNGSSKDYKYSSSSFSRKRRTKLLRAFLLIFAVLNAFTILKGVKANNDLLHVHIIPHSHCDPGWLDTFERYYQKDVSHILSGVLTQLWADRSRRFIWAEISFFKRWWVTQNFNNRERFKTIVKRGQLEFIGGGWVQNDEANPTLESVVNQVSEGHAFLLETFGVRPKIGWQIDPFGHSAMTPTLFALLGYDAMVINRIHFDTKRRFKASRHMEFLWDGAKLSNNNELDLKIFTHVLHTHYSAPRGFDFENPGVSAVSSYNADGRARSFASMMRQRQRAYMTNHLLVPFGDDFKFKNAARQFSSMGNVIEALNRRTELKIHARYSTLSEYFSAVHDEATKKAIQFPLYQQDFMPYADNGDSYWTGYYTTRPTLKAETRNADATLRSADLLYVLGRHDKTFDAHKLVNFNFEDEFKNIRSLRENAALVLHHDAITGTARQTVVRDYLQRLTTSQASVKKMSVKLVQGLLVNKATAVSPGGKLPSITSNQYKLRLAKAAEGEEHSNDGDDVDKLATFDVKGGLGYPVIVQNPLGWRRQDVVKVILSDDTSIHDAKGIVVVNDKGVPVLAQVNAELSGEQNARNFFGPNFNYVVYFKVDLPPLGLRTYYVCQATRKQRLLNDKKVVAEFVPLEMYLVRRNSGVLETKAKGSAARLRGGSNNYDNTHDEAFNRPTNFPDEMSIENDRLRVTFDKERGMLQKVVTKKSKAAAASGGEVDKEIGVNQQYMYYTSSRSGAYIFRPHGDARDLMDGSGEYRIISVCKGGPVVEVVHLFDGVVRQTAKVLKVRGVLSKVVQMLTSTTASMNNEVVTRFTTDLTTNNKFYTDNSADFRERTQKHGSIASNFYPMNTAGALKEGEKQITFLNRQPMGCASLKHGSKESSFEIMLHRQLRMDDGRGLAQGVHDSSRTSAPIWILIDSPKKSDKLYKRLRHHLQHDKVIFQASPGMLLVMFLYLSIYLPFSLSTCLPVYSTPLARSCC